MVLRSEVINTKGTFVVMYPDNAKKHIWRRLLYSIDEKGTCTQISFFNDKGPRDIKHHNGRTYVLTCPAAPGVYDPKIKSFDAKIFYSDNLREWIMCGAITSRSVPSSMEVLNNTIYVGFKGGSFWKGSAGSREKENKAKEPVNPKNPKGQKNPKGH